MSETVAKETKAQKVERLKREKNPWHAFDEVRTFARAGRSTVLPEWAGTYFKWWGIYTQSDGAGVTGGAGGEGKASEYFMMRIGLPNGIVTSAQLRTIGDLAQRHARNLADITVRQNIQLHWLTIESLPEVVDALTAAGLSPKGACGDVVRNVTGCPLAGIEGVELLDASGLAREISNALSANDAFYNLPRKFKISVTGCPVWCSYPEINDIGLTATRRGSEVGYSVRVGGGLSADPHLAVRLDAFVPQQQALSVVLAITEIFREQQGLRESRDRARLKHLFLREGWTAESFLAALEAKLGHALDSAEPEDVPDDVYRDHVGVHPQKQAGLVYVGAAVLRGRVTGEQLQSVAGLAEQYGSGELRTTVMQNILIPNVRVADAPALIRELNAIAMQVDGSHFWRGGIACTGSEFCKLAITETKGFTRWLVEEMETRLPQFDQQLKLHVTGCPNSCGQHWIADLGLEGKKIKQDGHLVDAYYFCVGGAVGAHAGTARPVGYRCAATDVPEAVERLLRAYLGNRTRAENLRSFFHRHTNDELRNWLAGAQVLAVERDLPAQGAQQGVPE
jgi:sulfite reductase (ferredoxin)